MKSPWNSGPESSRCARAARLRTVVRGWARRRVVERECARLRETNARLEGELAHARWDWLTHWYMHGRIPAPMLVLRAAVDLHPGAVARGHWRGEGRAVVGGNERVGGELSVGDGAGSSVISLTMPSMWFRFSKRLRTDREGG